MRIPTIDSFTFSVLVTAWLSLLAADAFAESEQRTCRELRRFKAAEAHQAAAVDETHFYAITNRAIGKYDKQTGERVARWDASEERPLVHLNSGMVLDGKLYCAHSNYPVMPATSSVEIWDTETLEHIESYSFGPGEGSLTWIDRHDDSWWAVFAYYSGGSGKTEKGTRWTTLVQYDDDWRQKQAWVFPDELVTRFEPYSNSGASWGDDGLLYCTGHDDLELYAVRLPQAGSILELVEILPINVTGQGIAWDRSEPGVIYGIDRKQKEIVVSKIVDEKE